MIRTVLALFTALVLGAVATDASAGGVAFSVPGVVNDGLRTMFSCTNGGAAPATVTVSAFNKDGTASGFPTSAVIPVNGTNNFATGGLAGFVVDSNLGAGSMQSGSARISGPSGVFCAAFVADSVNNPPSGIAFSLPVISKNKQRGD